MAASHIFKVVFVNQGKVYEIYARKVGHGALFGFIEVEELVFGERSAVVVDPVRGEDQSRIRRASSARICRCTRCCASTKCDKQGVSKISALEGGERRAVSGAAVYARRGQEIAGPFRLMTFAPRSTRSLR